MCGILIELIFASIVRCHASSFTGERVHYAPLIRSQFVGWRIHVGTGDSQFNTLVKFASADLTMRDKRIRKTWEKVNRYRVSRFEIWSLFSEGGGRLHLV